MQKLKDRVGEEKDEDIKRELTKGNIVLIIENAFDIKNAIILNSLLKCFSNNVNGEIYYSMNFLGQLMLFR